MAANLKISQLNAAAALTGAELVEVVQNGANVQTTATALAGLAQSTSGTATDGYVLTADGAGGAAWEEPAGLSIADIDDTPVNGETAAPISSNWAYDQAVALATETDARVLYDEELTRAVAYATDLAGQAARSLGSVASMATTAAQTAIGSEVDARTLADQQVLAALTYATDLAGQAVRELAEIKAWIAAH